MILSRNVEPFRVRVGVAARLPNCVATMVTVRNGKHAALRTWRNGTVLLLTMTIPQTHGLERWVTRLQAGPDERLYKCRPPSHSLSPPGNFSPMLRTPSVEYMTDRSLADLVRSAEPKGRQAVESCGLGPELRKVGRGNRAERRSKSVCCCLWTF